MSEKVLKDTITRQDAGSTFIIMNPTATRQFRFAPIGLFAGILLLISLCCSAVFGEDFGITRRRPVRSDAYQLLTPPPVPQYSEASPSVANNVTGRISEALQNSPEPAFAKQLSGVARVIGFDKHGQSLGSGTYIGNYGEYGVVLSNWHVIDKTEGLVHIHFPNDFSTYGAVIQTDKLWDLTLSVISQPPRPVSPVSIASALPKIGEPLWIAGFGAGAYRLAGGDCVRYLAPEIPKNNTPPVYEIVELSVSARQGDSGGPILNGNGELAGVLFGSDMVRNTAGSCSKRVNFFLFQARETLAKLPRKPEELFVSIEPLGPVRKLQDTKHITLTEQKVAEKITVHTIDTANPRQYTPPSMPASFTVLN
jgi:S1-C subfamily serine protease